MERPTRVNDFSLTDLGGGTFAFQGRIDPSNAGSALAAGQKLFQRYERVTVDVDHADCASTVGMALLLEWSTWSSACGTKLSYTNASSRLIDMVKLNDVEDLLQFTETRS